MDLKDLFSPIEIRGVGIANRAVMTAHSTGLSEGGGISDRLVAYYEARARGGVGLIVVGTTSVHPTSTSRYQSALVSWDDSVIPSYRHLADVIHPLGTRLFLQINHAGDLSGAGDGVRATWAPSAVDTELAIDTPHEMTEAEIEIAIRAFANAAIRAREGHLDGVEIHAGHGNLIQQFLSPLTNRRSDHYGGSFDRRLRFAEEVAKAVRTAVGPDFPVGIRMTVEEDLEGGITLESSRQVLHRLVQSGDLDYVSVTSGSDTSSVSLPRHYAPMYTPNQHMRHLARAVKKVIDVPVISAGRISDPRDAEELLRSGDADLIGMTRALIADPEHLLKAGEGRLDEIRYCVGINDGCIGRLFRGLPITCVQDPGSGRELELPPIEPAATPKRVMVVGAGPAGLEAARVAAVRGHQVMLLEAEAEPGGQVRLARLAPGRSAIGGITDQLIAELERRGVEISLGKQVLTEDLLGSDLEAVIIATGSEPLLPDLPDEYGRLVSTRDVYGRAP